VVACQSTKRKELSRKQGQYPIPSLSMMLLELEESESEEEIINLEPSDLKMETSIGLLNKLLEKLEYLTLSTMLQTTN